MSMIQQSLLNEIEKEFRSSSYYATFVFGNPASHEMQAARFTAILTYIWDNFLKFPFLAQQQNAKHLNLRMKPSKMVKDDEFEEEDKLGVQDDAHEHEEDNTQKAFNILLARLSALMVWRQQRADFVIKEFAAANKGALVKAICTLQPHLKADEVVLDKHAEKMMLYSEAVVAGHHDDEDDEFHDARIHAYFVDTSSIAKDLTMRNNNFIYTAANTRLLADHLYKRATDSAPEQLAQAQLSSIEESRLRQAATLFVAMVLGTSSGNRVLLWNSLLQQGNRQGVFNEIAAAVDVMPIIRAVAQMRVIDAWYNKEVNLVLNNPGISPQQRQQLHTMGSTMSADIAKLTRGMPAPSLRSH